MHNDNDTKFILRNKLETFREQESKKYKNPIFKYETINYLIKHLPQNIDDLKKIKGLSNPKIKKYGNQLLGIIQENNNLDLSKLVVSYQPYLWIIIDLETTGLSWYNDDIIQLCVKYIIRDRNDQYKDHSIYTEYISTSKKIPYNITQLTGITQSNLINAPKFEEVYDKITKSINNITNEYSIKKVFWLAHNGLGFDFLFWFKKSKEIIKNNTNNYEEWFVDTLEISKTIEWSPPINNHKLNTIHKYLFGIEIENAHRADIDVIALYKIFLEPNIQKEIYNFVYPSSYLEKKILTPPRKLKKIKEVVINQDILTTIIDLCKLDESIIKKHLLYFLEKYPLNQNSELISNFIKNYK